MARRTPRTHAFGRLNENPRRGSTHRGFASVQSKNLSSDNILAHPFRCNPASVRFERTDYGTDKNRRL